VIRVLIAEDLHMIRGALVALLSLEADMDPSRSVRQLLDDRRDHRAAAVCCRPVCLPVLARLWRPRRTGKIAFAREMVEVIAARHPDRLSAKHERFSPRCEPGST
jgi:hypothetical protein